MLFRKCILNVDLGVLWGASDASLTKVAKGVLKSRYLECEE